MRPKEGSYGFGNKHVRVIKSLEIPVEVKGRKFSLTTKVVEGDIPWLLGKPTLKRMGAILDIRTGYMKITDLGNVKVPMEENSGGHLVVRLKEQPKTRYVWWRTFQLYCLSGAHQTGPGPYLCPSRELLRIYK